VLINGTAGAVITVRGRTLSLMGFIVASRKIIKIIKIDTITDPGHVGKIAEAVLGLNERYASARRTSRSAVCGPWRAGGT
jgi:hypothetical protein